MVKKEVIFRILEAVKEEVVIDVKAVTVDTVCKKSNVDDVEVDDVRIAEKVR